ncbi:MAG: hydrogen gas-evolving membrane-bound hydrogenase subunit E [Candidatus Omnitrophota bacterium]|jgi:multisubunit Na+/H+ antiporter MnhB subunit
MIEINLILIFMIAAAIIAVHVKDLLSSVIAIGAAGIGLSIAFLLLKAPDLAIMQLVVEILSLIILVRGTIRKDIPFSTSGRWVFNTVSTLSFVIVFLTVAYFSLKNLPQFGNAMMKVSSAYLPKGVPEEARNVISDITLNFRSYDTLGEATVLFAAIIGVLAIARGIGHKKDIKG